MAIALTLVMAFCDLCCKLTDRQLPAFKNNYKVFNAEAISQQ